jgi:hypothetical protein
VKEYPRNVSKRHGHESDDPATLAEGSTRLNFLSVEPSRVSVDLTWTALGHGARYMVFSQEIYGVYFTKRKTFKFVGLEPGKTYHVFVLAVEQGPQCIAFAEFETLA